MAPFIQGIRSEHEIRESLQATAPNTRTGAAASRLLNTPKRGGIGVGGVGKAGSSAECFSRATKRRTIPLISSGTVY